MPCQIAPLAPRGGCTPPMTVTSRPSSAVAGSSRLAKPLSILASLSTFLAAGTGLSGSPLSSLVSPSAGLTASLLGVHNQDKAGMPVQLLACHGFGTPASSDDLLMVRWEGSGALEPRPSYGGPNRAQKRRNGAPPLQRPLTEANPGLQGSGSTKPVPTRLSFL